MCVIIVVEDDDGVMSTLFLVFHIACFRIPLLEDADGARVNVAM